MSDPGPDSRGPQGPYRLVLLPPPAAPQAAASSAAPPGHARPTPPRTPSADPEARPAADAGGLGARLVRVPTVADRGGGDYEFGERDTHGVMQIQVEAAQVRVLIPRGWVPARGPQVFALVFMMAEWLGWDVHDLQIGSILKKDVVLQGMVAMRQAQLEAQGVRVPRPLWNGPPDAPRPPGMSGGGSDPQEQ